MGNQTSKANEIVEISYKTLSRRNKLNFQLNDDFPYPRRPKNNEIEKQMNEICKDLVLTEDQQRLLEQQGYETKWKLICKHRFMMLTTADEGTKSPKERLKIELFIEELRENSTALFLDDLRQYLQAEAGEEEKSVFLYEGLHLLIMILERAEICSRGTKNITKQLTILKIIENLLKFKPTIQHLLQIPNAVSIIFMNFSKENMATTTLTLEILNFLCWNSQKGLEAVLQALTYYKTEKNGKHRFEPLVTSLEETKDAIFVEILVTFVNVIIESLAEDDRRQLIRSEVSNCGLKTIYEDIKEKIHEDKYKFEESSLDPFLSKVSEEEEIIKPVVEFKHEPRKSEHDHESSVADSNEDSELSDGELSNRKNASIHENHSVERKLRTSISINANVEIFQKHLKTILEQIELFENGFQEFNEGIIDAKEFEKVDLSDLRNLFEILKTGAVDKEHFKYFLGIMQHLLLIPDTDKGVKIWKNLYEMIMEIVSGTKKDSNLKVKNLRKLFYEAQTVGELENQVKHLENTLWFREQEIERIISEKRKLESDHKRHEEDIRRAEVVINQQCELSRLMELKLANDEARLARIIEEKDEKIKLLEQRAKDLAKTLSYAPSYSSINSATTNVSSSTKNSEVDVGKVAAKPGASKLNENAKDFKRPQGPNLASPDSRINYPSGQNASLPGKGQLSTSIPSKGQGKAASNAVSVNTKPGTASQSARRDDSLGFDGDSLNSSSVQKGSEGGSLEKGAGSSKAAKLNESKRKVTGDSKTAGGNAGDARGIENYDGPNSFDQKKVEASNNASKAYVRARESSGGKKKESDSIIDQQADQLNMLQAKIEELDKENKRLLQEIEILKSLKIGSPPPNDGSQSNRHSESFSRRNKDPVIINIKSEEKSKEVIDLEKEVEQLKSSLKEVTEASKNKRLSISNLQNFEAGAQNALNQHSDALNALPNLNEARRRTRTEFFHIPLRESVRSSILRDSSGEPDNRLSSLTSNSNYSESQGGHQVLSGRNTLDPSMIGESPTRGGRTAAFRMSISRGSSLGLAFGETALKNARDDQASGTGSARATMDSKEVSEGDSHATAIHSSMKQRASILSGFGGGEQGSKHREKNSSKERSVKFCEDNLEEIQEEVMKSSNPISEFKEATVRQGAVDEEEKFSETGKKIEAASSISPPPLTLGSGNPPPLLGGPIIAPPLLGDPPILPPSLGGFMPPPLLGIGGPPLLNLFGQQRGSISKPKRKPRVPMKSLMWKMLSSNTVKGTIWADVDDINEVFDENKLEEEFSQKRKVDASEEVKKQPVIKQKVTTLTPDRNKNIELILNRLKLSNSSLCEALITMDQRVLTFNNVTSLSQAIPTEQELQILLNYTGDKGELANPDKFFLELCEVPGYAERIQAMKFYQTVQELIDDLEIKTEKIFGLFTLIPKDRRLFKLLQMILAVGNYLNGESARGGCFGFKIDTLEKVAELKSNDGKKILLQYIIETIEKNEGNEKFIDVNEDLTMYEIASKTAITQLSLDLKDIIKGAKVVEEAMNKQSELPNDKVQEFFLSFSILINEKVKQLDQNLKSCIEAYEYCCKYFGESPKDTSSDVFSQSVMKFWMACKKSKQAIIKLELQKKEENRRKLNKSQTISNPAQLNTAAGSELRLDHASELAEAMRLRRTERKTIHKKAINVGTPINEIDSPKLGLTVPTRNTTGSPQARQSALLRMIAGMKTEDQSISCSKLKSLFKDAASNLRSLDEIRDFIPKLEFTPLKDRNATPIFELVKLHSQKHRRAMTPDPKSQLERSVEGLSARGRKNFNKLFQKEANSKWPQSLTELRIFRMSGPNKTDEFIELAKGFYPKIDELKTYTKAKGLQALIKKYKRPTIDNRKHKIEFEANLHQILLKEYLNDRLEKDKMQEVYCKVKEHVFDRLRPKPYYDSKSNEKLVSTQYGSFGERNKLYKTTQKTALGDLRHVDFSERSKSARGTAPVVSLFPDDEAPGKILSLIGKYKKERKKEMIKNQAEVPKEVLKEESPKEPQIKNRSKTVNFYVGKKPKDPASMRTSVFIT